MRAQHAHFNYFHFDADANVTGKLWWNVLSFELKKTFCWFLFCFIFLLPRTSLFCTKLSSFILALSHFRWIFFVCFSFFFAIRTDGISKRAHIYELPDSLLNILLFCLSFPLFNGAVAVAVRFVLFSSQHKLRPTQKGETRKKNLSFFCLQCCFVLVLATFSFASRPLTML